MENPKARLKKKTNQSVLVVDHVLCAKSVVMSVCWSA